jgi:hypothetical protein
MPMDMVLKGRINNVIIKPPPSDERVSSAHKILKAVTVPTAVHQKG